MIFINNSDYCFVGRRPRVNTCRADLKQSVLQQNVTMARKDSWREQIPAGKLG